MDGNPIFPFTKGVDGWKHLLSDPDKHWRTGFSARTLAHCWESAVGLPPEIERALGRSSDQLIHNVKPLIAIPEFTVPLPGGVRPSQSDVFVLARSVSRPVVLMVEGKVDEPFGPTLQEWLEDETPEKRTRFEFLLMCLGLDTPPPSSIRYQLIHRAASALITAAQFRAPAAVMVIHSFSLDRTGWEDYQAFAALFERTVTIGKPERLTESGRPFLFGVWVEGDRAFLES